MQSVMYGLPLLLSLQIPSLTPVGPWCVAPACSWSHAHAALHLSPPTLPRLTYSKPKVHTMSPSHALVHYSPGTLPRLTCLKPVVRTR